MYNESGAWWRTLGKRLQDILFVSSIHNYMIVSLFEDRLELVNLVLVVAKLGEQTGKVALVLGALLGASDGLVHTRGTADEDLDVLLAGVGQDGLEELLGDNTLGTGPVLWGVVEGVEGAHTVGELVLEVFPLALEEDVLLGDVTEDEGDLCVVVGVLEDGAGELVHGGDAGTTSDQGDVVVLVGLPGVLGDGTLHVEPLSRLHVVKVLRHGTAGVLLDDKVDVADGILVTDGSVGTDDGLLHLGALVLCNESRSDGEARNAAVLGEVETQSLCVVVDDLALHELQADEALVTAGEALGGVGSLCGNVALLGL
jgi:hypothetical protein